MIAKELMEILACPSCKGPVKEDGGKIVCQKCGLVYPIQEGVPVMLIDQAMKPEKK